MTRPFLEGVILSDFKLTPDDSPSFADFFLGIFARVAEAAF
jgi:hypothetical protein